MFDPLTPDEVELDARHGDAVAERITRLIRERLEYLADAPDSYDRLYRDPADWRLWELTYPMPEYHGGGPVVLTTIAPERARAKYPAQAV